MTAKIVDIAVTWLLVGAGLSLLGFVLSWALLAGMAFVDLDPSHLSRTWAGGRFWIVVCYFMAAWAIAAGKSGRVNT